MRSMTGHGRGQSLTGAGRATVELRAVNRKQAELLIRLPAGAEGLEPRVREVLARVIARGRVEATVTLEAAGTGAKRVNLELARQYAADLGALARDIGLREGVTLEALMRCPGVIESTDTALDADEAWGWMEPALRQAAAGLDAMREREGAALAADLAARVGLLREAVGRIRQAAPEAMAKQREHLVQRLREAGWTAASPNDDRVARELLLYADRMDVAEELARLESHFAQFDDCLKSGEAVGRRLDFLAQEMGREINTIGSKANDARMSADVVNLKTELERFREQAQNVE